MLWLKKREKISLKIPHHVLKKKILLWSSVQEKACACGGYDVEVVLEQGHDTCFLASWPAWEFVWRVWVNAPKCSSWEEERGAGFYKSWEEGKEKWQPTRQTELEEEGVEKSKEEWKTEIYTKPEDEKGATTWRKHKNG